MTTNGIEYAILDWRDGAPRSPAFGDIYFSGDGPAETEHIFLAGNDLPARFQTAARFVAGELGFGTGLNFLVAWDAWRRAPKPRGARFHFFSAEAFPLHPDDLAKAHAGWPALADLAAQLRAQYPPAHPDFHRMDFDDGVSLTLFFGDALDGLAQGEFAADAWFLDGFAPEKNPAMWRPELMAEVARRSNDNATFATFTVAGAVRRALKAAGFATEKRAGFGRKREMLAGKLTAKPSAPNRKPWFDMRRAPLEPGARVAVIGAGIAGASLAYSLRRAGFAPTFFDAHGPAGGASGNPAGLIMPRLDAGDTPAARFHVQAYLHTVQLLQRLNAQARVFNPCGVTFHAASDAERERREKLLAMKALPARWMEQDADGLFFPQGGVVDPPAFVRVLIGETPLRRAHVQRLVQGDNKWRVETAGGDNESFDAVMIANGLDALRLAQARGLPLSGSAGQLDWFPDAPAPDHAHAFGPYAAPAPQGGLIIGATYAPVAIGAMPAFTPEATRSNIAALARFLPHLAANLDPNASRPRAGVRCTTPDRLPVAGPVPDWGFYGGAYDGLRQGRKMDCPPGQCMPGLFILSGLGSRGLVTAPLAAAMIAAEMTGAPSPVGVGVAEALHPARFFIRDLKRGKSTD